MEDLGGQWCIDTCLSLCLLLPNTVSYGPKIGLKPPCCHYLGWHATNNSLSRDCGIINICYEAFLELQKPRQHHFLLTNNPICCNWILGGSMLLWSSNWKFGLHGHICLLSQNPTTLIYTIKFIYIYQNEVATFETFLLALYIWDRTP